MKAAGIMDLRGKGRKEQRRKRKDKMIEDGRRLAFADSAISASGSRYSADEPSAQSGRQPASFELSLDGSDRKSKIREYECSNFLVFWSKVRK